MYDEACSRNPYSAAFGGLHHGEGCLRQHDGLPLPAAEPNRNELMVPMRLLLILVPLALVGCTQRAWYDAAQTASCESAGQHHGVHCASPNGDAYRAMKQDEAKRESGK
jgi:hypothetical protein